MKQNPITAKVKVEENPVKFVCIDCEGTYLCFGQKDLKNCLLDHPTARAFKAKELEYSIDVTIK